MIIKGVCKSQLIFKSCKYFVLKMEEFVANKSERAGHFSMFENRNKIWIFVKENRIKDLCEQMKSMYQTLVTKLVKLFQFSIVNVCPL